MNGYSDSCAVVSILDWHVRSHSTANIKTQTEGFLSFKRMVFILLVMHLSWWQGTLRPFCHLPVHCTSMDKVVVAPICSQPYEAIINKYIINKYRDNVPFKEKFSSLNVSSNDYCSNTFPVWAPKSNKNIECFVNFTGQVVQWCKEFNLYVQKS